MNKKLLGLKALKAIIFIFSFIIFADSQAIILSSNYSVHESHTCADYLLQDSVGQVLLGKEKTPSGIAAGIVGMKKVLILTDQPKDLKAVRFMVEQEDEMERIRQDISIIETKSIFRIDHYFLCLCTLEDPIKSAVPLSLTSCLDEARFIREGARGIQKKEAWLTDYYSPTYQTENSKCDRLLTGKCHVTFNNMLTSYCLSAQWNDNLKKQARVGNGQFGSLLIMPRSNGKTLELELIGISFQVKSNQIKEKSSVFLRLPMLSEILEMNGLPIRHQFFDSTGNNQIKSEWVNYYGQRFSCEKCTYDGIWDVKNNNGKSVCTIFPHGVQIELYKNNRKIIKFLNGLKFDTVTDSWKYNPVNNQLIESKSFRYSNGSIETVHPNGLLTLQEPSGFKTIIQSNGSKLMTHPIGIFAFIKNKNNYFYSYPNGLTISSDNFVTYNDDANQMKDNSITITHLDGVKERFFKNGTYSSIFPNGATLWIGQNLKVTENYPHGLTKTYSGVNNYVCQYTNGLHYDSKTKNWSYFPEKNIMNTEPKYFRFKNGTIELVKKDGSLFVWEPNARKPIVINPQLNKN